MINRIRVSFAIRQVTWNRLAGIVPCSLSRRLFAAWTTLAALFAFSNAAMGGDITLAWDPSVGADLTGYKVYYGTAPRSYGTAIVLGNVNSYTVTGLPVGTYYFAVTALAPSAESDFSAEVFTAIGGADSTPPMISAVASSGVTYNAAVVGWTTDEASDTQVEYGATSSYSLSAPLNAALSTAHSQVLSGLAASTAYHYRVKSRDAAGNLAVSGDFTFATSAPPDTAPPVISAVSSSSITYNAATITWTTNEASDTQVEFGTTNSYGSTTILNTTRSTTHSQALSGLATKTTYHYRVKSSDAAGNLAVSGDFMFTTLDPVDIKTGLVAAFGFDEGTGSTAADASGNGNNATLNNVSWTSNAKSGKALSFGGSRSYVNAGLNLLPAINGPKTIAFWVYLSNKPSSNQSIVVLSSTSNAAVVSGINSAQATVRKGSGAVQVSAPQPAVRVWHHFAYSFDGTTHRLYLDGAQVSNSTISSETGSISTFQIGRRPSGSEYYKGLLDELRVYTRALSLAEIQAVMNTSVTAAAKAASAVEAWHGSGETVSQAVGVESVDEVLDPNTGESIPPRLSEGSAVLDFKMSQESYGPSETIGLSGYRLLNNTDSGQIVELKTWLAGPGMVPVAIGNHGSDGEYLLPAGLPEEFGPMSLFPVTEDMPGGSYLLAARILDPTTGDILSQSQSRFSVSSSSDFSRTSSMRAHEQNKSSILWGSVGEGLSLDTDILTSASGFDFRNTGTQDAAIQLKFWLEAPGQAPIPVFGLGSDGSLVLPAGSEIHLEPLSQFCATHTVPSGLYHLKARMMDAVTGQTLDRRSLQVLIP